MKKKEKRVYAVHYRVTLDGTYYVRATHSDAATSYVEKMSTSRLLKLAGGAEEAEVMECEEAKNLPTVDAEI